MKIRMLLSALLLVSVSPAAPSSVEEELIGVEMAWSDALHRRDPVALDKLLADEYQGIDASGGTFNKEQDIASSKSGDYMLQSYKFSELKVRVYGEVATVTGINVIAAAYKGRNVGGRYRFSDVFVKRDGRWQCVVSHSSYIYRR
jgi:ketosteroid isomerase-like protein